MEAATTRERDDESQHLHLRPPLVPAEFPHHPFLRRFEREAEGLVPPYAPPAREALAEDRAVAAVVIGILPWRGAETEVARADYADEEGGREGEDGLECYVRACEGEDKPVGAR